MKTDINMALILNIETTTEICSVSVARDGVVIGSKENFEGLNHASMLTVNIQSLLESLNLSFSDLDAVAVSKGPGSYTGLRIGVSVAKGLCFGASIPMISVSGLESMTSHVIADEIDVTYYVPMIDARRMEVFNAIYDKELNVVDPVSAKIIDQDSYQDILKESRVAFFGNGADKCREVIVSDNAVFIKDIYCSAKDMAILSYKKFQEGIFEDVAYFEPFYLKNFVAIASKKPMF